MYSFWTQCPWSLLEPSIETPFVQIHDEPQHLELVSPTVTRRGWDGSIFAELEASFSNTSLSYHAVASFRFSDADLGELVLAGCKAQQKEAELEKPLPMRIITKEKMRVFELMTGNDEENINQQDKVDHSFKRSESMVEKLKQFKDDSVGYGAIAMPEVEVIVYYGDSLENSIGKVETKMKLKRVIRYQHLARDYVDEDDFPPTVEYMLYSCPTTGEAFLSHCPNRWPDFQQLIRLDEIPQPFEENAEKAALYQVHTDNSSTCRV